MTISGFLVTLLRKQNIDTTPIKSKYILSLQELAKEAAIDELRTLRYNLAWVSITRPDISALANIMS